MLKLFACYKNNYRINKGNVPDALILKTIWAVKTSHAEQKLEIRWSLGKSSAPGWNESFSTVLTINVRGKFAFSRVCCIK